MELPPLLEKTTASPLYSEDLAPIPPGKRTWCTWHMAALWVGMAVCIPTYLLASYMMRAGLDWQAALIIIGLANLVITVPMVLNGHAGVKYGIPFPVQGRAPFGTLGVHVPSLLRALVACGWFGVNAWIGGLSLYSIWSVITGSTGDAGLSYGKFIAFGVFWTINIYFIWKGTERIKWLEAWSAPVLIGIGIALLAWGAMNAGGFIATLGQGKQLQQATVQLVPYADHPGRTLGLTPLLGKDGKVKATEYRIISSETKKDVPVEWLPLVGETTEVPLVGAGQVKLQFRDANGHVSSMVDVPLAAPPASTNMLWQYLMWFTAMVGFWATMAISISDITRFATTQKAQVAGQFIGLPGTMMFYSFVGIFVTCAAVVALPDVLISEDAPWDPVSLIGKFNSPGVVIFAQFAMLIATLSTNIAANIIAPANAISNLFPKRISFRMGGLLAGLVGIVICPWWLMDEISGILVFVSGLLGPVLGILLCDYFIVRKRTLSVPGLYAVDGEYSYTGGVNTRAMVALAGGVLVALAGFWVKPLEALYQIAWFTGFGVSFVLYALLMRRHTVG